MLRKLGLIVLMLVLNHTLVFGVMAGAHGTSEHHDQFEATHLHLSDQHEAGHHLPSSTPEGGSEHIEHAAAHVHIPCDVCAATLPDIVSTTMQAEHGLSLTSRYWGLSYQPAVPPPNL